MSHFSPNAYATLVIFVITLILMLKRPWNIHESWATAAGAGLMLICGSVKPSEAMETVAGGLDVLIFLFALMLFSSLLDSAGFFEWSALHAARAAQGKTRILYRNVFLAGAATTALLSLDTTAIILTPIVVSLVQKLNLKAHPFLLACAFVANTGSLLLPVSNLTNLLFQHAFKLSFLSFAVHMLLPQLVAIMLNYWLFAWMFGKSLPETYDQSLPAPSTGIKNRIFFNISLLVLFLVLIGYFVGSLNNIQPYVVALTGSAILLIAAAVLKRLHWSALFKQFGWGLFPFVIGLFIVVKGVQNLGLANLFSTALTSLEHQEALQILSTAFATGFGSNIVNNVPMALLSISVLKEAHQAGEAAMYASILGCNLGPNLTIAGSLATMLVISAARKRGEDIGGWEFFKTGALVTPLLLLVSSAALWLTLALLKGQSL